MRKELVKRLRGWLALVLCFGMMFGNSLAVFAAEYWVTDIQVGDVLNKGDVVRTEVKGVEQGGMWHGSGGLSVYYCDSEGGEKPDNHYFYVEQGKDREIFDVTIGGVNDPTVDYVNQWKVIEIGFEKLKLEPYIAPAISPSVPEGGANSSRNDVPHTDSYSWENGSSNDVPHTDSYSWENGSSNDVPHTHSYSWVTVQEATVGQDGIEEYRCSCGDVQGRNVIPASVAFVDGFYDEIMNVPQNGTATFDSGWLCTLSDDMIKKLAERTDVTTVITFEYQKQSYRMTIPAGADFASLLADEECFYGYFYFANVVGATIEAL